jgi:hypothetical protein
MSFYRPRFLDDLIRPLPSASPRIRGLKGFDPHDLVAMQDPLYADDPTFWCLAGVLPASPANLGHIGVQVSGAADVLATDSYVVIVDYLTVSCDVAEVFVVDVASPPVAEAADTAVFKMNRREASRPQLVERAGLLRVFDNANANTGTTIAVARVPALTQVTVRLGFRLYGTEQCFVRNSTINTSIQATMYGRLTLKGQR